MAKKRNEGVPTQLPLPNFLEQLQKNQGKSLKYRVSEFDIGGQLLPILSKGLYPDPLDFIREYVQNAVDGLAANVHIEVTGRSVNIYDDGEGMSIEDLVEARKVGLSPKSLLDNVGFRGIGIYSGFDICNRLTVASKRSGQEFENILEFDFEAMRKKLETGEESSLENPIALTDLISEHSQFKVEHVPEYEDENYTQVHLDELSETHYLTIMDRHALRNYILKNLPIDFDDEFDHKVEVNRVLRENVDGYNAVIIHLAVEGQEPEVISRPAVPNLRTPTYGYIKNGKGENVAYYWACLHDTPGGRIPDEYKDYRGFTYKVKGFTIGDNSNLKGHFTIGSGTLYNWYTGEVYVLDPSVRPNSARDDFEASSAKEQLEIRVGQKLKDLQSDASDHQKRLRADKTIGEAQSRIEDIETQLSNQDYGDLVALHHETTDLIEKIDKQVKNSSNSKDAKSHKKHAESIQKQIRRLIDTKPKTSVIPPDPPTETDSPKLDTTAEESDRKNEPADLQPSETIHQEIDEQQQPESGATKSDIKVHNRTLSNVFTQYGYELDDVASNVVRIIDIAVSDVIGYDTDIYATLVQEIEFHLSENDL